MRKTAPCPCGSTVSYNKCCGRFHDGSTPETAELLMRSRYTAFYLHDENYLLNTWHSSTRPASIGLDAEEQPQWFNLRILNQSCEDNHASVEFVARYKINGKGHRLQEKSRFVKEQGRWFYVDGDTIS